MQKILKRFLTFGLALVMCLGIATTVSAVTEYTVAEAATNSYYNSITATGGSELLGQLHDLITSKRTKYSSYSDCKSKGTTTDPGSASNTVMEFYTHQDISSSVWDVNGGWNREHVWPKADSNGLWQTETVGGGSDLHHVRPAEKDLNAKRGNLKYGEVKNGSPVKQYGTEFIGGYKNSTTFEPMDNVKGDVARILMYVYTHYNSYSNPVFEGNAKTNGEKVSGYDSAFFGTLNYTHIITASNEAAAIKLLLQWNKSDPVDAIETKRNEAVYKIQGNRNPFIDNSDYADAIWGEEKLQSISLNATALTLNAGGTYDLTVSAIPSSVSNKVEWASSNGAVATVSDGKVTAKAAGTATITATSAVDSSKKATATVTVLPAAGQTTGLSTATITIGSFTLSADYGFKSWTADGISGTAFIYGNNSDNMQFNTSKSSYYIASTSPTSAPIKSVTVTSVSGTTDRQWKLLTSTTPYGEVAGAPDNGTEHEAKTVTSEGVTWTLDGSDTYFALVREGSGAAYLQSVVVEYGTEGSSETPAELQNIYINPTAFTLNEGANTKLAVLSVPSTATAEVSWTSSDTSVATVSADGTVTAVKAGTATITATCNGNSQIKATATVTVTSAAAASASVLKFHNTVAAIKSDGALAEWRTTINTAIEAYKKLSADEKSAAAADVEALRSAISSFNDAVNAYNGAADDAEENALKAAGKFV